MFLSVLLAAAAPVPCSHPALTLTMRQATSALLSRSAQQRVRPGEITDMIEQGRWRLVWATPADAERGVFFLRRNDASRWRFVDLWGGVIAPDERAATIGWARGRGADFPSALARCFADALLAGK